MDESTLLRRLLLLIGLTAALLGQCFLFRRGEDFRDGLLMWGAAVLAFALLLRSRHWGKKGQRSVPAPRAEFRLRLVRGVIATLGALASFIAAGSAVRRPSDQDFSDLLALWIVGSVWFVVAFVPVPPLSSLRVRLVRWCRTHAWEGILVVTLVTSALLVRSIGLERAPANLGGDEGTWGLEGAAMLTGGRVANPFCTRWLAFPSLSFLATGIVMRLAGTTVSGVRLLSAVVGALSVAGAFALARELFGKRVALYATVFLAFGHYHIHYSRLAYNNIGDALCVSAALWFLVRGLRRARAIDFALSGAAIGLGWYGYFGARLIGIIVVIYLAVRAARECSFLNRYGWLVAVMVGSAAVVVAPLMVHYGLHPEEFAARSSQVSIFGSGWLTNEVAVTGRSAAELLLDQCWKSISAFHYTLDPTFIYRPTVPLLDAASGIFLVLGIIWFLGHMRYPGSQLHMIWLALALVLGWVITENPPASQRLVIVTPLLAIAAGVGLNWVVISAEALIIGDRRLWHGLASLCLVAVGAWNVQYYFLDYTPTRVYGNPTAEVATDLARALNQRADDCVVYLHASPFMYWDFATIQFMAPDVTGFDVPMPGDDSLPLVEPDPVRCNRFAFLPERMDEMAAVRERHPGGVQWTLFSEHDGRPILYVYDVAARQQPADTAQ
ncbi:MAG: hypothetical protein GX620_00115 [Chloroflexi bacterium]|nr:hypothetical protein [Chloroflexota bacterium]